MWRALTSDLNEFVNTVAGDTAEALNRMDENFPDGAENEEELSPAEEERLRRMESHETFDLPLISDDDDEEYKKDVKAFLDSFKIDEKTDEITKLLEENPDTLKLAFEALVPTKVTYEVFWQCYFYRCDEDRINKEIEEEEKEAAREAEAVRKEAIKSISAVGSFFDGAVKAVSKSLTDDSKKPGSAPFGSGSRPPFVLNTAVDEDEDEEEELGWDDDEEGEEEGEEDDGEGQIEFNDAVTENLQEQLKLALGEREQLHQTVEMQKNEIATLKSDGAENTEIEKLKTKLFEMESEIAALHASAADSADTPAGEAAPTKETVMLAAKVEALNNTVESLTKKAEEDRAALQKAADEKAKLEAEVTKLRYSVEKSNGEVSSLKSENKTLKSKLDEAEKHLKILEEAAGKIEEPLLQKEVHVEPVEEPAEVEAEEEANVDAGEVSVDPEDAGVDAGRESVDSPDTVTSAVKVEAPTSGAVPSPGGEPDGDWDDEW